MSLSRDHTLIGTNSKEANAIVETLLENYFEVKLPINLPEIKYLN